MTNISERPAPRIVCAASRFPDGLIIASARHSDAIFVAIVERLKAAGDDLLEDCIDEQGFIDQYGTFYNREEARRIAAAQGQIWFAGNWGERELFSENLY